jgi:hypothetical protein
MIEIKPNAVAQDDPVPDALKDMLLEAIKGSAENVQRVKCLELAVQLPDLTGADEAIEAAEKFRKYITEGTK